MYKDILVPVDVEKTSSWQMSLPVALEFAEKFKATLHFVTVVPDLGSSIVSQYFPADAEAKMMIEIRAKLHSFTEANVPAKIPHRHIVAKGPVYQGVIDTADEINADLIIMEAHRPELKDYLLGPNAAKVVRHSDRSVLVVRDQ